VGSTVAALVVAAIVLVAGLLLGWFANRTYASHGDIKTTRGRIAGYRKTRTRSGLIAIAFIIVAFLTLAAIVRH
jgi:hypothetical protein